MTSNGKIEQFLIYIRSSLWFVPALMILGATLLAAAMVTIDLYFGKRLGESLPQVFSIQAEAARGILSAIAGSMATIAGVAFSITIVALALASSQYTPRVLRNFMRDRANQSVLGVFVGVYIYCLLVLRSVSNGSKEFVPAVAVLGALVLAVIAIGFFIFFIHHISSSIQVSEIAANITHETLSTVNRLFPEEIGSGAAESALAELPQDKIWHDIPSLTLGYIQSVEPKALLAFAKKHDAVIRMECGIGDFISPGRPLLTIALDRAPDDAIIKEANQIYAIASYRTIDQDVLFGIRQLVDISLKALSPGINDTTTAITCIEHISVVLARCAQRCMPTPYRYDQDKLRVIAKRQSFDELVQLAFSQILESAPANTAVITKLLISIEWIAQATHNQYRLAILHQWVNRIEEVTRPQAKSSYALEQIEEHIAALRSQLEVKKLLLANTSQ